MPDGATVGPFTSETLKRTVRSFFVATFAVAVAIGIRWLLAPVFDSTYKFATLYGAIAVAVWYGGWQLAVFAAVLGYAVANYLFIWSQGPYAASDIAGIGPYVFSSALITWLGTAMRNAQQRAAALSKKEQKRERFIASILDSIRDCFYTVDRDWRFTYINDAAASYFGRSKEELLGQSRWNALPSDVESDLHRSLRRAMREQTVMHVEGRSALTHHWIDLHAYPLPDGLSVFFTDAEERHNAEKALARASQRVRTLLNNTPLAVIEWDKDFRISQWSGEAESVFGWKAAEVLGRFMTDFPLIFEEDKKKVAAIKDELSEGGKRYVISHNRNNTKSGKVIDCEWYNSILEGPDGKVEAVLSLVLDVTERHHLQEQLQDRMLELKEADRRKDEFLATLAHELRNPLAPLTSSLEIMRLAGTDKALHEQAHGVMARQCRTLVRLIDDLLDLSRITTGKLKLKPAKVHIAKVLLKAIEAAEPLMALRKHRFSVNCPEKPLYVVGDADRLAQILTNLLRNAAKFTDAKGNIALSVAREHGKVIIRVRDNGIGIPHAKLESIFDMFSQAHADAHDRGEDGLGIGLHLARRLVQMHDGTITARSAGPGQGSEFIVELPELTDLDDSTDRLTRKPNTLSRHLCILVVDDNEDAANSMATLLKMDGHEAYALYDGVTACEAVEQTRPDVVLLDLGMPGMDGYETARRIRQSKTGKGVLLIAVSGWAGPEEKKSSSQAGFNYHLAKPVKLDELKALLSTHFFMHRISLVSTKGVAANH